LGGGVATMSDEQSALEKPKPENISQEEYFERIKPFIIQGETFRLEMIYDAEKHVFIIQGDENGLKRFGESVLGAAHPAEKAGYHTHWDQSTTTLINVSEVIVRRVDSYSNKETVNRP
jgi:hypothetical protein